jgi:glutamate-ammonia-ligase adenylyltransferase
MAKIDSDIDQSLTEIPESLRPQAEQYLETLQPTLNELARCASTKNWRGVLPRVIATSDFVAQQLIQQPRLLQDLSESGDLYRRFEDQEIHKIVRTFMGTANDVSQLKRQLRRARRRETVRLAFRALAGWADVPEILSGMSALADACIAQALDQLFLWALEKNGAPSKQGGTDRKSLVVLGLGKLGGGELNFSSDVDLIFAYGVEDDGVNGQASNHEFYVRLGQSLIKILSETTEDGFVFRVDLRLRPNGESGPLALSLDAMEHYYQTHGREWERYALIKARVVAGDRRGGVELLERLRPFIYRKYLDYGVIEAIRNMKSMINRELQRKGIRDNIKLGPGGIREIEFIAQALQLIRGGRQPSLQVRGALAALSRLSDSGDLTPQAMHELSDAYRFLRDTENRLQMIADRQNHTLPGDDRGQTRLAYAMGYPDWREFEAALNVHRRRVDAHFANTVTATQSDKPSQPDQQFAALWLGELDGEKRIVLLRANGYDRPEEALALLHGLRNGPHYHALSTEGRTRLDRLMPALIGAAARENEPHTTLTRLIELIEAIGRRSVYLVLLSENPMVLSQVAKLCAASAWISRWLSQHPILLDELLDPRSLNKLLTRADLNGELRTRLAHIPEDDFEMQLDILREFRHGHVLRVAAADIAGALAAEQVGLSLAEIAEVVLDQTYAFARLALVRRHGEPHCSDGPDAAPPGFAVIAYGKLGSFELGYASDLDMIFLYEGCDRVIRSAREDVAAQSSLPGLTQGQRPIANESFFARLGQRIIHIITARTAGGNLYEVDMRLRPSGNAGPLVTSIEAFRSYQLEQAWTWEHQALARARAVAGSPVLCRAFEEIRRQILARPRDPQRLRRDVKDMRARMLENRTKPATPLFDVKQDPGGIVDIEFMVQYWVLRWTPDHPRIAQHTDNINILESLVEVGRLEPQYKQVLVEAYRRYLSVEHRLKLMEREPVVPRTELDQLPDEVARIWNAVMNEE